MDWTVKRSHIVSRDAGWEDIMGPKLVEVPGNTSEPERRFDPAGLGICNFHPWCMGARPREMSWEEMCLTFLSKSSQVGAWRSVARHGGEKGFDMESSTRGRPTKEMLQPVTDGAPWPASGVICDESALSRPPSQSV